MSEVRGQCEDKNSHIVDSKRGTRMSKVERPKMNCQKKLPRCTTLPLLPPAAKRDLTYLVIVVSLVPIGY